MGQYIIAFAIAVAIFVTFYEDNKHTNESKS